MVRSLTFSILLASLAVKSLLNITNNKNTMALFPNCS